MKTVTTIARYLLGITFVVFSLNFWFKFIPLPAPEEGSQAATFMGLMIGSGYLVVVKVLELLGGALLLVGRYVNLGLALLGPIVVNICLYHIFILKGGYPIAVLVAVLAVVALAGRREFINSLMAPK